MASKTLKFGWILLFILGLYRGLMSFYLYFTKVMDLSNGLVFLANAVAIIFIAMMAYKQAEKWSWWCMLFIGAFPLLAGTMEWDLINPWIIIGWVLLILGLFIPIKDFFGKK